MGDIGWLAGRSEAALRAALARRRPDLDGRSLTLLGHPGQEHPPEWSHDAETGRPQWYRSAALVGGDLVVKFAWSEPAARKLWHEGDVMRALNGVVPALAVPVVESLFPDPVLVLTRRLPGGPVWYADIGEMPPSGVAALADQFGAFLAALHSPAVLAAVSAVRTLGEPVPQAGTDALRDRLGAFVDHARMAKVRSWCDWVDAVLSDPVEAVLVHGDFAGHNVLWRRDEGLIGVVDFEEAAAGDFHYDLRYLPAQAPTLDLLHLVATAYGNRTGRAVDLARVMAWHVRTALGDTLWRSEAGGGLPWGGTPNDSVDETGRRLDAAGIDAG